MAKYRIVESTHGSHVFYHAQVWKKTYWYNLAGTVSDTAGEVEDMLTRFKIMSTPPEEKIIKELEF